MQYVLKNEVGFFGQMAPHSWNIMFELCYMLEQATINKLIAKYTFSIRNIKGMFRISKNIFVTPSLQSAGNQRLISSQVGTSETTRTTADSPFSLEFCQWLAGLIDGDGCLLVSKQGYTSCEITMGITDEPCLRYLQDKIGGSIKVRTGVKALRWRLHNKAGMSTLIGCINGHIRHTGRLVQLHKVCQKLGIIPMSPEPLTKNNAWFAGFFDADGTVTFSFKPNTPQLTISVTNKDLRDVEGFKEVLGGNIYFDSSQNGYYKWSVQSRSDVLNILDYFNLYPSRSHKTNRLHLIPTFFALRDLKAYDPESSHHAAWKQFDEQWHKNDN